MFFFFKVNNLSCLYFRDIKSPRECCQYGINKLKIKQKSICEFIIGKIILNYYN